MRKLCAAVVLIVLCAAACHRDSPLIIIDGKALPTDEVYYCLAAAGSQIVEGDERFDWDGDIQGQKARDYIRMQAVSLAVSSRAIENAANRLGVALTDEENKSIDSLVGRASDEMESREDFEKFVRDIYGNADIYRYYGYAIPYLNEKVVESLFSQDGEYSPDEETLRAFYGSDYINVSYILISASDSDGKPLAGEDRDIQRAVAEGVRRETLETADFSSLVMKHGQDYAMSFSPDGMPVVKGSYEEAFNNAMEALRPGEISDVIEGMYGFYIIKRLEDNPAYFDDNRDSIREQYVSQKYADLVAEWSRDVVWETTKAYDSIDPKIYYKQI